MTKNGKFTKRHANSLKHQPTASTLATWKWYFHFRPFHISSWAVSTILPPIWERMHSNCHLYYGTLMSAFSTILMENNCLHFNVLRKMSDWRTPTKYMAAFIFESLATAYVVMVGASLLLHGFGSCLLLMAFIKDIETDLRSLNAHKRNKITDAEFYKYICKFIQFHTEIKQLCHGFWLGLTSIINTIIFFIFNSLTENLGTTYALLFTSNLLWTLSTMAVVLVSLQMELVEYNLFD